MRATALAIGTVLLIGMKPLFWLLMTTVDSPTINLLIEAFYVLLTFFSFRAAFLNIGDSLQSISFKWFTKKRLAVGGASLALLLGFFLLQSPASAEELLKQAKEQKIQAMRKSCETIGDKYARCFSGNLDACKDLRENSIPWFQNEYGVYPEFACSSSDTSFLSDGGEVKPPKILVIHHTAIHAAEQGSLVEKNHEAEGYPNSFYDSHIAYHFLVGTDGTIKQNRALSERSAHTRNQRINFASIAIAVAGNFQDSPITEKQLNALVKLIKQLDSTYHFVKIIPHREASPTACPGKYLDEALWNIWREPDLGESFRISRYYSPEPAQLRYFRSGPTGYKADVAMNCGLYSPEQLTAFKNKGRTVSQDGLLDDGTYGDCLHTANGYKLTPQDAYKVAACPPEMPFGTKLEIDGIGTVTCVDRGGAIKQKRLDIWAGIGEDGLKAIYDRSGGWMNVKVISTPKDGKKI